MRYSITRTVVSLLAAFAMVIHFTFGCCLHGSHDAGHEDDHHDEMVADDGYGIASAPDHDAHACGGCRCVADTMVADQGATWRPLDSGIDAALDTRDLAAATCAAGLPAADDGGPPSMPAWHPLSERLLV